MTSPPIGPRLAALRRRRGLSQVAVAGLVGRSESWLSQVERGLRDVDSLTVLRELARVLRVDLDDLVGVARTPSGSARAFDDQVERVERALFEVTSPSDVAVAQMVRGAHGDYQAARYEAVLDVLPTLLPALPTCPDPSTAAAGWTVAAKTLTKLGLPGPALVAADRGWAVGRSSGDPADIGMTAREVAAALQVDDRPAAERIAIGTAELVGGEDPPRISVEGALWLLGAVIAARAGAIGLAEERLDRADLLAQRLGADANHRWTAFGPTNVAIHRVSVAVELGDVDTAVAAADGIDVERLPPVLRSRRTQVQLDLAWAYGRRRRDADALIALLEVERRTPEVVRRNAQALDTVRSLLERARGPRAGAVRALADRAGVGG